MDDRKRTESGSKDAIVTRGNKRKDVVESRNSLHPEKNMAYERKVLSLGPRNSITYTHTHAQTRERAHTYTHTPNANTRT